MCACVCLHTLKAEGVFFLGMQTCGCMSRGSEGVRKGAGGVYKPLFHSPPPPAAWQTSKCTWGGPQKGEGIVASCGRTVPH